MGSRQYGSLVARASIHLPFFAGLWSLPEPPTSHGLLGWDTPALRLVAHNQFHSIRNLGVALEHCSTVARSVSLRPPTHLQRSLVSPGAANLIPWSVRVGYSCSTPCSSTLDLVSISSSTSSSGGRTHAPRAHSIWLRKLVSAFLVCLGLDYWCL